MAYILLARRVQAAGGRIFLESALKPVVSTAAQVGTQARQELTTCHFARRAWQEHFRLISALLNRLCANIALKGLLKILQALRIAFLA